MQNDRQTRIIVSNHLMGYDQRITLKKVGDLLA